MSNLLESYKAITTYDMKTRGEQIFNLLKDCHDFDLLIEIGELERKYLDGRYKPSSLCTALSSKGWYKLYNSLELIPGKNAVVYEKENGMQAMKHAFMSKVGLTDQEMAERNSTKKLQEKIKADALCLYAETYLKEAYDRINSSDWREIVVGLEMATGRRTSEITSRGRFTLISGRTHEVIFEGQLKKRGKGQPYTIPTLLPAKMIVSALNRLRKDDHIKNVNREARIKSSDPVTQNKMVNDRLNTPILREVKKLKGLEKIDTVIQGDGIDSHGLRAAYAALVLTKSEYKDCSLAKKMDLVHDFLGHAESESGLNLDVTIRYSSFRVVSEFASLEENPHYNPQPQKADKKIDVSAHDHARIVEFQKRWGLNSQHATISALIDLAEKQLEQPTPVAFTEIQPVEVELETETLTEPKTETKTETHPEPETDTKRRLDVIENLLSVLASQNLAIAKSKAEVKTRDTETKTKTERSSNKQAEAMIEWKSSSYEDLKGKRGTGVSFERCDRVFQAVKEYNKLHRDPEKKISLNKSLLRLIDGCHNDSAQRFCEYFDTDIYNKNQGITQPEFHNRTHHAGKDLKALLTPYLH